MRLILNLKKLNTFSLLKKHILKWIPIHTVFKLVTPNCWMGSLDLKDKYYSVKIHPDFQTILKLSYKGTLYTLYTAFPNGLCTFPRKFTKMMKPPLAFLRQCGHICKAKPNQTELHSQCNCCYHIVRKHRSCHTPREISYSPTTATCLPGFYNRFCSNDS